MASKPILFNTEMVRAISDGRKSMTRRVIKLPEGLAGRPVYDPLGLMYAGGINRPKYQVGDILWVRETWSKDENGEYVYRTNYGTTEDDSFPPSMFKWKPSIHMPREAARIFLKVTNVRVERLQEITEEDAIKEGTPYKICGGWHPTFNDPDSGGHEPDFINGFSKLWNSIYATPKAIKNRDGEIMYYESYPWEDIQETREHKGKPWYVHGNPWVWVYEFERVSEDGSRKDE